MTYADRTAALTAVAHGLEGVPPQETRQPKGAEPPSDGKRFSKTGKITDAVLSDVVIDKACTFVGSVKLDRVKFYAPARMEGCHPAELNDIWMPGRLAEFPFPDDPDMQQENNHKLCYLTDCDGYIDGFTAVNNDDCFQIGKGTSFEFRNGVCSIQYPYIRTHRDAFDVDRAGTLKWLNVNVHAASNCVLFSGDNVAVDLMRFEQVLFTNFWTEDIAHRAGHMLWIGSGVKEVKFIGCWFDPGPKKTIVAEAKGKTKWTFNNSVYFADYGDHHAGQTPVPVSA